MKVIAQGKPKKAWTTKVKCTGSRKEGCGAKLLVELGDVYKLPYEAPADAAPGEEVVLYAVCCPECGAETAVELPLLAPKVIERIPFKKDWVAPEPSAEPAAEAEPATEAAMPLLDEHGMPMDARGAPLAACGETDGGR
jgi:hypothetical protein